MKLLWKQFVPAFDSFRSAAWGPFLTLLILSGWLVACVNEPAAVITAQPELEMTVFATQTTLPSPTSTTYFPTAIFEMETETETAVSPPSTSLPPTTTPTTVPIPTPNPYANLTIDALTAGSYGGGKLDIIDTLEENETFTRYLITYPSDGLTVYGFMNVPNEGSKFPVALLLHGYIDPAVYNTVTYTRRYADALAEAGYFVIHPNFRNYPPSDSGPNPYRIGYAIDALNLIAIIREQSQEPLGYLRRADADRIHLWGHSMGGGVVLRVITVLNEPYLRAAVLYGSMSGDEQQNYEQIQVWTGGRGGAFELAADPELLTAISPSNFLKRITTPISIHHSEGDETVPIAWSNALCQQLGELNHPVECHTYYATPHTFRGQSDRLFMERVVRFFDEN